MSKMQTKIKFVEKKKTSARLHEAFVEKKKDHNNLHLSGNETLTINWKSPRKNIPIGIQRNNKSTEFHYDKLANKENKVNSKTLSSVEINRSPIKRADSNVETSVNERYALRSSPLKSNVDTSVNERYALRSSPLKSNVETSVNERYTLRSSPLKRGAYSASKNILNDNGSSPPKRECTEQEIPRQLISKLNLDSPEQNIHARKELFPKGKFDEACKALHSSAPTKLPGREDKLDMIKEYLIKHAQDQSSGTLYISGPPGTGKTASVNVAVTDSQIALNYKVVCLNCTSMNSCGSVYKRIVGELKLKVVGHSEKSALSAIEKHLDSSKRKMILIVLDELDQLCSNKQSVLYSIFEWPSRSHSRLVLIGIANALDLTDRVLPRLQARLSLQPTVIHFPSYTRQQIIDIIIDRLHQAGVEELLSGATLQLLAGKVAAVNGDVRRALDIARRVVEVAERRTVLQTISDNASSRHAVTLQEVLTVVNNVYNTAQSFDSSQTCSFPLQQKLLVCALLLIRQTSKVKDITIGKLHEVYKKVCDRRNMSAIDISEFISLTSLVEARGILQITGKNHNRLSKVVLQWNEGEVKSALQDKQLLASVLMDKGVTT